MSKLENNRVKFGELNKGDLFLRKGRYYRKWSEQHSGRCSAVGDPGCGGAQDQHGYVILIGNNTLVTPVSADDQAPAE